MNYPRNGTDIDIKAVGGPVGDGPVGGHQPTHSDVDCSWLVHVLLQNLLWFLNGDHWDPDDSMTSVFTTTDGAWRHGALGRPKQPASVHVMEVCCSCKYSSKHGN